MPIKVEFIPYGRIQLQAAPASVPTSWNEAAALPLSMPPWGASVQALSDSSDPLLHLPDGADVDEMAHLADYEAVLLHALHSATSANWALGNPIGSVWSFDHWKWVEEGASGLSFPVSRDPSGPAEELRTTDNGTEYRVRYGVCVRVLGPA